MYWQKGMEIRSQGFQLDEAFASEEFWGLRHEKLKKPLNVQKMMDSKSWLYGKMEKMKSEMDLNSMIDLLLDEGALCKGESLLRTGGIQGGDERKRRREEVGKKRKGRTVGTCGLL